MTDPSGGRMLEVGRLKFLCGITTEKRKWTQFDGRQG